LVILGVLLVLIAALFFGLVTRGARQRPRHQNHGELIESRPDYNLIRVEPLVQDRHAANHR
jgi:hypothetical protein